MSIRASGGKLQKSVPITRRIGAGLIAGIFFILLAGVVSAAPGDLVMKRKEGVSSGFPVSVFPHWIHRINYRCDACHISLFEMKAGSTETSMAEINEGRSCGTCHNDEKAFAAGFSNCNRCHVPPDS